MFRLCDFFVNSVNFVSTNFVHFFWSKVFYFRVRRKKNIFFGESSLLGMSYSTRDGVCSESATKDPSSSLISRWVGKYCQMFRLCDFFVSDSVNVVSTNFVHFLGQRCFILELDAKD